MNYKDKLLTTLEFAKLCNVTKHTLFHYDDIGLLKPYHVGENGYRYYQWQQTSVFDLITMLKDSGSSLEEIKTYLKHTDTQKLVSLLKKKQEKMTHKIKELHYKNDLVTNTILNIEHISKLPKDPFIQYQKESYYVIEDLPKNYHESIFFQTISNHIHYCKDNLLGDTFFIGFGIATNKLPYIDMFSYDFIFSEVINYVDNPKVKIKKAGLYVTYYHKGNYESISTAHQLIQSFLSKEGYQSTGYAFEFEVVNYLLTQKEDDYITKIIIPIEKI